MKSKRSLSQDPQIHLLEQIAASHNYNCEFIVREDNLSWGAVVKVVSPPPYLGVWEVSLQVVVMEGNTPRVSMRDVNAFTQDPDQLVIFANELIRMLNFKKSLEEVLGQSLSGEGE